MFVVDPVTPEAAKTGPATAGQPVSSKLTVDVPWRDRAPAISRVQVETLPALPPYVTVAVGA